MSVIRDEIITLKVPDDSEVDPVEIAKFVSLQTKLLACRLIESGCNNEAGDLLKRSHYLCSELKAIPDLLAASRTP